MDPNQLAIILGLLTNGLYSLILFGGYKLEDLAFREEDIRKRLTRNDANFTLIIEEAFQDIPPIIKPEEFYKFLKSNEVAEIVKRIYSFGSYDYRNLNNGKKIEDNLCEDLNSLEGIKESFCEQLTISFSQKEEISAIASQLFSILVECCLESLDVIIKEDQDLSALDYKIKFYFKVSAEKLAKYQEQMLSEIKTNQMLLRRLLNRIEEFKDDRTSLLTRTEEFYNKIISLLLELQSKGNISHRSHHYINMAPDLETGFIQREAEYKQLVEGLLNNQNDTAVAITTALRGAGGYGKTTLAKTVCHDPKIKDKFFDGILWVTLGENPKNLIGHIQDLICRLSNKRPEFEGLNAAVSYFRDLLHKKCLLLVIDDVWDSSHLEPFMQGGTECVRLITTRINEVLPEDSVEVHVDTMKNEEAAKLLRSGLSYSLSWANDQKINKLAKRLGYWPLLLKMVNSALKQHVQRGKSFEEALDHVNHKLDRKNLTAFDSKNPQKRNQAVEATISVSFDLLDQDELERYKELAIFPEDEEINLKTVERLWGKTANYDEFDVEDLCYKLFNLSLLQTYDANKKVIKLHDVVRDYLIEKQQQKIHRIHSLFLEAYEVETWADLPQEESYLWKNLSYHLVEAGKKAELRNLLLDFKWMKSKLNYTDVHLLLDDYDSFSDNLSLRLINGAIRLSAHVLSRDKLQLGGQLLGRLQSFSEREIISLVKQIWNQESSQKILPLTNSLTPPGKTLISIIECYCDPSVGISVASDGKYVLGSEDRTLKVCDLNTGKVVHTLTGHSDRIEAFSVTPDGYYAVTASSDKTLKVWNLKTGKEVQTLIGHSDHVKAVSITPDGNYAVSVSSDKTLKVWDLKNGKEIHTLESCSCGIDIVSVSYSGGVETVYPGYSYGVEAVSIAPDRKCIVSGSNDGTLKVWDIENRKEIHTLQGHSDQVKAVSITPDEKYIISASSDKTLKVWDIESGKEVHTLNGHFDAVIAVTVTPDRRYVISGSKDRTLKVWDFNTGKEVHTLEGHSDIVWSMSVTPDGKSVISHSSDWTLNMWDIETGKKIRNLNYSLNDSIAISVTPDGNYVISTSDDEILKIWNFKAVESMNIVEGHVNDGWARDHYDSIWAISVSPDGKYAVSASTDNTLKVWDLKTRKEVHTLIGHSDLVETVSIMPNGKYVISASWDKTIKFWNIETGEEIYTLKNYSDRIQAVSITPNGKYIISGSDAGMLIIWGIESGEVIYNLEGHSDKINAVSITPDGKYAVSGSKDHMIKVWDIESGKKIHTLIGHFDVVQDISVTPNGKYIVSASSDKTLKVWDIESGKEIHTLEGHCSVVWAISITLDGEYVVSASEDDTFKVWDLKTEKEVHTLKIPNTGVVDVSITSNGKYAVSISSDRSLHIWDFKIGKEISAFDGDSPFLSLAFSPDGNIIVAGDTIGRVHFLLFEGRNYENK